MLDDEHLLQRTNVLGLLRRDAEKEQIFDADGRLFTCQLRTARKVAWWSKLLAYTVYNPLLEVSNEWRFQRRYELLELQGRLKAVVADDDDILTQFIEHEELIQLINKASSFQNLCWVMTKGLTYGYSEESEG